MKIDFFVGENPYQSTHYFSEKFSAALRREGAEVRLFDIREGRFYQAFYALLKDPPDLTCSFSDITVGEGVLLGDQWEIPHLSFLIDPAIYFLHHLKSPYSFLTCVDREDCALINALNCPRVCFLPHGVDRDLKDQHQERPYDIVMMGTCTDYEKVQASWRDKFASSLIHILETAAARVLSPEGISSLQALLEAGVDKEQLPLLHHELDLYIGGKDRVELVRAFKDCSVHIWGDGPWKKYVPQANVHLPVPFADTLPLLQKTKILLNSSPRFKQGSHERIFHGLVSGALVVTGENPYVCGELVKGKELLMYRHGQWAECVPQVTACLANETLRHSLVAAGSARVSASHTWDHRARSLLEWLLAASTS